MRTLGLIPARGGSKGIARKNVKVLAGKPLIAWTIEAALRADALAAVVVSTDDDEIATAALAAGAQVPFRRPAELAQDATPGLDPVLHALDALPGYDAVLLLQPTSPLRSADDIRACLQLAAERVWPSVVSVCEPHAHPWWSYRLVEGGRLAPMFEGPNAARRQELPAAYALNGALYFAHAAWLRKARAFVTADTLAYVMPAERSIDIDTELDWRIADMLLRQPA